jgi:hypothetical protein
MTPTPATDRHATEYGMKQVMVQLIAVLLMLGAGSATAHHSAAQFDFGRTVELTGLVKELRVANPHIRLVMEITDERGTRNIEFEGHSRNNVYRRGWRPDMLDVGDTVTIGIAPTRSGEDGGYVQFFRLEDGRQF